MNQYKIFGFEDHHFNYCIIVFGESVDQVFKKYRKIYGYFSAVQQI